MNKLFTKIVGACLGLTMAVGVGVAVASGSKAQAVDAASDTLAMSALDSSDSNIRAVAAKSTGSNAPITRNDVNGHDGVRMYANNTLTISSSQNITSLTIPWYANGSKTFASVSVESGGGTYTHASSSGNSGTWTGSSKEIVLKVGSSGQIQLYQIQYVTAAAKTLSSISVSGATTSFTVGDAFSFGGTVTAHYSDSTTANVTSSATFSGYNMSTAGNQTVTVTYVEGGTTKTATYDITVSAATSPTISLSSSSFSGYTGQQFSVTATFANLTSDFAWAASGAGTISGGVSGTTGDSRDGTSTYSGTLTGAGTKTLSASGGGANTQTYTITITKTTVSLNKASTSISVGKSETLTATTNVGSVTWNSSNTSAATVSNGVVSVPSNATVGATSTITATSAVDTSVKATCTVTVAEAPFEDVLTDTVIGTQSATYTSSWAQISNIEDSTGAKYMMRTMKPSSGSGYTMQTNANGYFVTTQCPSNAIVKSISFGFLTSGKDLAIYGSNTAYTAGTAPSATSLGTVSGTGSSVSFDFSALESTYKYVAFKGTASSTTVGTITVEYEELAVLDSVTTSGQTTLFTAGNNFSYGGTLTAHYTGGKADDTVTPAYFKYGASGINPTSAGTSITTSTTLTKAEHDGKYIYVVYTEDEITKYCSYQITVNYAAVTSVVIGVHAAEIGLNETYNDYLDTNKVSVTVNSEYANQGYEWIVSANTVNDKYSFDESGLLSGDTEGTITLRCRSTADNSKYDELVVTVTGDPTAEFVKESTSGYAGKSEEIAFTYGNMDDVSKITVVSSNTSSVTVANDLVADEGEGLVTINFVAAGSANVTISYDGGATLDTLTVSVSADSVTSVSWNASNFDVFSGTTLTSDIDNTWLASYEMASGDEGLLEYGDYTLKLGGNAITLPHTWGVADSGKNLCIEYGGVSSSTVSVTVTQTINAVYAPTTESNTVSWTASAAADLGSQISSEGDTDTGTISTGTYSWNYTRTLTSLASGKSDNISFQGSTWIQLGSNNAMESIEFSTSEIPGTIKSVSVVVATAGSHVLTIDVGGTKYLEEESLTSYSGTAAAANPDPDDCIETGTGSSSGAITITIAPTAATKKAMVIRSISVTYETSSGQDVNIANSESHKAAQRVAVKFAKAFNAAMDETENCTEGLDDAWSTCSSAYNTFKSEAAALGSTEEAYAKNLIKYATAQYSDDSGEVCIERMMKTYEVCVQKHSLTPFMSDLVSLGRAINTNPLTLVNDTNVFAIIVVISMVSVTCIGGYIFLRKRKEN